MLDVEQGMKWEVFEVNDGLEPMKQGSRREGGSGKREEDFVLRGWSSQSDDAGGKGRLAKIAGSWSGVAHIPKLRAFSASAVATPHLGPLAGFTIRLNHANLLTSY